MADLGYDFLNDSFFGVYQAAESPKVELNLPLMDSPVDISNWAVGVTEEGTPIVKDNRSQFNINNNPEEEMPAIEPKITQDISKPKSTISTNEKDKKKIAKNFFVEKGLTEQQAAGIVGNLMQESQLNTSIRGDGGKSFGIAQWNGDRRKGLQNFAKERGTDISDLNTQLEYIWKELNSTHKSALEGLLQSRNSDEATIAFMRKFERPNEKYANLTARIKYAKSCLS